MASAVEKQREGMNVSVHALLALSTHPILNPLPQELFHPREWAPINQNNILQTCLQVSPTQESLADNLFPSDSTV